MSILLDMRNDLLDAVQSQLLPTLPLPARVISESTGEYFGDASVSLGVGALRVTVTRDKLQILVSFGPASDLGYTVDSGAVFAHLGLTETAKGFGGEDLRASLAALAQFLRTFWVELVEMFESRNLSRTKASLDEIRRRRAERLFGPLP